MTWHQPTDRWKKSPRLLETVLVPASSQFEAPHIMHSWPERLLAQSNGISFKIKWLCSLIQSVCWEALVQGWSFDAQCANATPTLWDQVSAAGGGLCGQSNNMWALHRITPSFWWAESAWMLPVLFYHPSPFTLTNNMSLGTSFSGSLLFFFACCTEHSDLHRWKRGVFR